MVTIASTPNSSLHHLQTFDSQNNSSNHLRDASFSSYLNTNEETFSESSQNFNLLTRKDPLLQGVKKEEDGEIGVFGAEKYFNGLGDPVRVSGMDAKKFQYHQYEETSLEAGEYNKDKYGTPSVRSESSWNSQGALLQSSMRESSRNNKAQRKSFLAGLGCKYCSCSDKNSVDVSDHSSEVISFKKHLNNDLSANHHPVKMTKPQAAEQLINNKKDVHFQKQQKSSRENRLAFSTTVKNSGLGNQLVKMQLQQVEKQRKSLEVFGSPILDSRISKSLSFDKRLTMMPPPWDDAAAAAAPPKLEGEIDLAESSGGIGNNNYNDDAESDASSDLFEIESLTGKSNSKPFLARPTPEAEASGCASPTNCYAPSEASIEWSVVTASAVEYSAMSDCEDQRSAATIRSPIRPTSNGKPPKTSSKEMHRRRPAMLLGCKSHKAVGVAVDAFTTCEKPSSNDNWQIRHRSETSAQATRFQAEATKEGNFGVRHGQQQQAYATPPPPLQRSHSPRASQLLYI